jgi:NTP pyrophosphatase (non-canonical NTP hydrolase)
MTFSEFSKINRARSESPDGFNHKLDSWSLPDWMTATMGELGEAANITKKLNRVRDGIPGNATTESELRAALRKELADVYCYLDLMCQSQGINLEEAVVEKFNEVSRKMGCPIVVESRELDAGERKDGA